VKQHHTRRYRTIAYIAILGFRHVPGLVVVIVRSDLCAWKQIWMTDSNLRWRKTASAMGDGNAP
jgi:hypothetical protein